MSPELKKIVNFEEKRVYFVPEKSDIFSLGISFL